MLKSYRIFCFPVPKTFCEDRVRRRESFGYAMFRLCVRQPKDEFGSGHCWQSRALFFTGTGIPKLLAAPSHHRV
jgi:hypothetical protein